MASSEDFKRILELYNQESKTSGVSIVGKHSIASAELCMNRITFAL